MQAAALKRPTGHRSKEASKQKSRFSETAKIGSNPLSETTNERCGKGDSGDGLCPFLQSRDDVPVRMLLVIGETNNNNCQKRVSLPFASLKSSNLALRFLQQNSDGQTSYQETTAASLLSPWFLWNSPTDGRWSNVKTTCSPGSTTRQQPTSPEVSTSRSPSSISSSSSSYQSPKTSDRKRWESLWKDNRPPDIAYRFQHYSDTRRYMDQYRKDHVHRKLSPRNREEEPINAATAAAADIRPVVPPLCPVPVSVSQSFQDPARLCLTQRAFRFAYVRQKSDLNHHQQQRSSRPKPSAVEEQTDSSSFAVDSEGNNKNGADEGRRWPNCQTTPSCAVHGGGVFSLPSRCNLRGVCRKRNSALRLPEFLTNRKKNGTSNVKDRAPRLTLRLPSKSCDSPVVSTVVEAVSTELEDGDCRRNSSVGSERRSETDRKTSSPSSLPFVTSTADRPTSAIGRVRQLKRFPMTTFIALSDLDIRPSSASNGGVIKVVSSSNCRGEQ